ncbi:MAG: SusD/RagB family nutrient-binding outer membrane lipoprotein [Flavobacteriales bacterium]|nr:MAG: SusD/RagB family nutrient-binding outer membrane lipoprotein [Flavobacteriales bacterium]
MKKILYVVSITAILLTSSGCKKWLDVNHNPNAPDKVDANSLLKPMLYAMMQGEQWDGRYVGKYVQFWAQNSANDVWDKMGYARPPSDAGGETWKTTYNGLGANLLDYIKMCEEEQRWDALGVGYILKAWGWQKATDLHGELIITEAFQEGKTSFAYDKQEFAYQEVQRLLNLAIASLQRTDGAVNAVNLAKGDLIYKGAREKWIKFAYGMLALNMNNLTNKTTLYDPNKVIEYVDKSFANSADDALYGFAGEQSLLSNFLGQRRANVNNFRQTGFLVRTLDGSIFTGIVDPRLSRMLQPAPLDTVYRGIEPTIGFGDLPVVGERPPTFFGTTGAATLTSPGRYLFDDKSKVPFMTYAQLQFVKAEAALRSNQFDVALAAYKNGIASHIDFVNATNANVSSNTATQILTAEKNAYLNSPLVTPAAASDLTLTHIMIQKYIAQFAWAFTEQWNDIRRYHYIDLDPKTNEQVFKTFTPPETARLDVDNLGNLVYRLRPRYASEYVWNRDALEKIGGLNIDFQTVPVWFVNP